MLSTLRGRRRPRALALALTSAIAISLGSLAALLGGVADTLISTLGDMALTIPHFPLLVVLTGLLLLT